MHERYVTVGESGNGPYGQFITSDHHVLGADEPLSLGGQDTGPDPYELLLAGLGSCTAMTISNVCQEEKYCAHAYRGTTSARPARGQGYQG